MWYLIIPPIIVILSLSFLLWYLSRKGADPAVAEKAAQMETETPIHFSRAKAFSLGILEKLTQRFKIGSLRMHNALHDWSQSIKERRRVVEESVASQQSDPAIPEAAAEQVLSSENAKPSGQSLSDEPIVRRKKSEDVREFQAAQAVVAKERVRAERPMVSETAVHPETKKKKARNVSQEEELIGRIAVNPKDFTAYEALGDHYMERENVRDAKECYRQVLRLSPVHRMVKIKIRRLEKLLAERKA